MNVSETSLSLLESNLRKPDAVLEPGVLEEIVKAIAAGGKPEQLVECLSDGYVGYPQMCNLVCSWLEKVHGKASQPHDREDKGNEYYFLKELVKTKFSAEKLAGVFSQYGGKPPPWMEQLCQDARGRKLIYELSATHRNCLLLDYGIQRILKMGHEDEVAQIGSSLASYFSVFHRLLTTRLRAIALSFLPTEGESTLPDPSKVAKKLSSLSTELVESCAKSAHTYFLAQLLLSNLGTHPRYGSVFKRASQDLEAAAAKDQPSIWLSMTLFAPQGLSMKAHAALQEVGEVIAAGTAAPLRLEHLLLMYQGSPDNLSPIQHPSFIAILISTVFTPVMKANAQVSSHQLNAILILAIATTRKESINLADPGGSKADYQADRRLKSTKEGLESALSLLVRIQGGKITTDDVTLFNRISKIPLVCYGIFHYLKSLLGQREFFQWSGANVAAQVGSRMVATIATRNGQSFLPQALEVIDVTLMALGAQFQDLTKTFLDACVVILREHGSASFSPIQKSLDRWAKEADPSLVRHLVIQILTYLAPPYSSPFATWMIHLIIVSGIKKRGHVGTSGGGVMSPTLLLQEFATVCLNDVKSFDPPIGAKELALLSELKAGGAGHSVGLK